MILQNLVIEKIVAGGRGLAHHDGKVVFVEKAVVGDAVDCVVTKRKKDFLEAKIATLSHPSPLRITPECTHFGTCGGCSWQHVSYDAQISFKQQILDEAFYPLKKILPVPEIQPIMGAQNPYHYRNKLEFTFSAEDAALGFHEPGCWARVFSVEKCLLQREPSNAIRNAVGDFAKREGIPFFHLRKREGVLRTLTLRTTTTGDCMVVVSFFRDEPILREKLLDFMAETFKEVTSLFYCINPCAHDSIDGLPLHHHSGKNHIQEKMEDLVFHIGPTSFFQANTSQAYVLYRVVRDFAALTGKERVYDLYTGAGTIALFLSSRCKEVIGIDLSQAAIEDAVRNRELNGIQNAAFYAGDMKEVFTPEWVEQQGRPDVLILNPSRSGLERKVVKTIAALLPEKVIYVSCNPATQVRDLEKLIVEREAPYTIAHIQPVDMFPHTAHVENVVGLVRK